MILQRREDEEDEQQQGANYAPPAAGLASATTQAAAPSFPALRRFVTQGQLQQANAGVMARQDTNAKDTLQRAGARAEAALANVTNTNPLATTPTPTQRELEARVSRGSSSMNDTDYVDPRVTQRQFEERATKGSSSMTESETRQAPVRGQTQMVGAATNNSYADAVKAIQAWQDTSSQSDSRLRGTQGDAYNDALFGDGGNRYQTQRQPFQDLRSRLTARGQQLDADVVADQTRLDRQYETDKANYDRWLYDSQAPAREMAEAVGADLGALIDSTFSRPGTRQVATRGGLNQTVDTVTKPEGINYSAIANLTPSQRLEVLRAIRAQDLDRVRAILGPIPKVPGKYSGPADAPTRPAKDPHRRY